MGHLSASCEQYKTPLPKSVRVERVLCPGTPQRFWLFQHPPTLRTATRGPEEPSAFVTLELWPFSMGSEDVVGECAGETGLDRMTASHSCALFRDGIARVYTKAQLGLDTAQGLSSPWS